MPVNVAMLAASLGLILLASILFTNGIELLGGRLKMHQGAVGSILAAVGTALPETIIPIIAILFFGDERNRQVAIGAIAGAPFMLATLAMFVTGSAVLLFAALRRRKIVMAIDPKGLGRDLGYFVLVYGAAVATTFVRDIAVLRTGIAMALLLSYGLYVRATMAAEGARPDVFDELWFRRVLRVQANLGWILVQVIGALAIMIFGAHLFVQGVDGLSVRLGASPLVLSIIITPIATELPEKFNSILWVARKRDTLAVGNITGAMVFQSSFPVAFGIAFTDWNLRGLTMLSAVLAFASALALLVWVKAKKTLNPYVLLLGGALYAVFIIAVAMQ